MRFIWGKSPNKNSKKFEISKNYILRGEKDLKFIFRVGKNIFHVAENIFLVGKVIFCVER